MNYLKQSTTTTIQLGPFLDSTDGVTAETGLTISSTDVYLSKGGAAFANPNDANAATHDRAGWYRKQLNATDTGTVGRLIVEVQETGALPVWREFMVVPANVYDSLVGGTDSLEVDVTAVSGDSTAADNLELDYDGGGYNKANSTIGTVTTNTDMVSEPPTAAAIADQVWDEAKAGHVAAGSFGEEVQAHAISTEISALQDLSAADVAAELETYDAPKKAEMDAGFAALNDPTVGEIADGVWDEILTAATHNIATSAGRRLRNLQDLGVYEGGAIWIDTINGTAGTTEYENGTVNNPVDSIADALTLATSVGLSAFHLLPGSSITLAASVDNYEFRGYGYTVALGGQSVSGAAFQNATINGNDDGSNAIATQYYRCVMGNNSLGKHILNQCQLSGAIILTEAADYFWDQAFSGVAGTGTPSVDFEAVVETKALSIRHYSGGIEFKNFGAGTHTASVEGFGQVVLNANCSGGTIAIRGNLTVTDNASGAVTLSDDARIDIEQITNTVWDEPIADHTDAGSTGEALNNATAPTAAAVADAVWDEAKAGHVAAGSFGEEVQAHAISTEISALENLSAAEVNAQVDAALVDIHLDHLLAVDYDPASKPGVGTALLNELVENDAGESRFTVNALENAPSGTGASAETIADAVWEEALADHSGTAGSTAEALDSASAPSAADVADAVWDEAKAGHVAAGSFGEEVQAHAISTEISALENLSAADVATELETYDGPKKAEMDAGFAALNDPTGDEIADAVWDEAKAGHVAAGSFGEEVQAHAISTEISALQDLSAADVAAELETYDGPKKAEMDAGFAALNDPTTADIADGVWDEAKAGHVAAGSFGEEVQAHALSTEVSALQDLSAADVAAELETYDGPKKAEMDAGFAALNDPTAAAIAQAVLELGAGTTEDTADPLSLTGVVLALFRGDVDENAGTMIVRKSDRATVFATENITTDNAALPITSVGQT